jgi:periplasmic divalent cation tolerance protein
VRTTALIAAFIPGASPPLVTTPIVFKYHHHHFYKNLKQLLTSKINGLFYSTSLEGMNMEKTPIVVLVTASSKEEAEKIVRRLLKERLIACANIIGPVQSLFWWQGKIDEAQEHLILMKTRKDLFSKLSEKVKALHSYQIPEIIAVPIVEGFKPYMEWLESSLKIDDDVKCQSI